MRSDGGAHCSGGRASWRVGKQEIADYPGVLPEAAGSPPGFVLAGIAGVLGPTHPGTLRARHNISRGLWADAALTWSFPEAELAELSEQIPVLDPEIGGRPAYRWAPSTSAALDRALAELTELDEAGDAQAVKERFACLLRRTGGYLPPDHPFHLRLRAGWYEWLGEEEDPEQAVTGYANLCQRTQSWPLDHPIRTLVHRSSAWWLAQTGSFREALAAIDRLSRDLASASTPTDPELIETRRVRAIILGESGDRPGAAEALRELLRTCAGHEELAPAAAEIRANLDYWDSPDP